MKIRIYGQQRDIVEQLLREADATSFTCYGSHDDSRTLVGINGTHRTPRSNEQIWVTAKVNEKETSQGDPGDFPTEILTAYVLETYAHHGSSTRSRSHLRLFARTEQCNFFLVFDIMEVGAPDSGSCPFTGTTLLQALLAAKKRISVSADADSHSLYQFDYWTDQGSYGAYSDTICSLGGKNPYLQVPSQQEWFTLAFKQVVDLIPRIRQMVVQNYLPDYMGELEERVLSSVFKDTILGSFLIQAGLN